MWCRAFRLVACLAGFMLRSECVAIASDSLEPNAQQERIQLPVETGDLSTVDVGMAERSCGRRSLFTWLMLTGRSVTLEEVNAAVPVSEQGTSLEQLQQAAKHWSVNLDAVRINYADLEKIPLPSIAHIWLGERSSSPVGHYIILLSVTPNSVAYADSAGFSVGKMSREQFASLWSGYLLIQHDAFANWLKASSIAIAVTSILTIVLLWLLRGTFRSTTKVVFYAGLFVSPMIIGCNGSSAVGTGKSSATASERAPRTVAAPVLSTSANSRDCGIILLGKEARATFTVSNVTDHRLSLHLGRASCACLKATLSKNIIEPLESAQLELLLSGLDTAAGLRQAAVSLGTSEDSSVHYFEARGIVEGMNTLPYAMRLPSDLEGFCPDPINGEIILSPNRPDTSVRISDIIITKDNGESAEPIELRQPIMLPIEKLPSYSRVRFRLPLAVQQNQRPHSGQYAVRITYQIGNDVADHILDANVYPRAE
jgi:hypothetical protein